MAQKPVYINTDDFLNEGREKINKHAIDPAYRAELKSEQAVDDANRLGNEAKKTANQADDQSLEAIKIAKDTNDNMNNIISGETDSAEIIAARKPVDNAAYPTLGERLNNTDIKINGLLDFETYSSVEEPFGGVRPALKVKLEEVKNGIDTEKYTFAPIFDAHYSLNSVVSFESYKYSLGHIYDVMYLSDKLDGVIAVGDNCDYSIYHNGREDILSLQKQFATVFFSLCQSSLGAILKGNHDDGSGKANGRFENFLEPHPLNDFLSLEKIITDKEFSEIYQQKDIYGEKRKYNSNYFYHDNTDKKVRIVGLDSSDNPEITDNQNRMIYNRQYYSAFSAQQIEWLAGEALLAPDGYAIIILTHWALDRTLVNYADKDNPYFSNFGRTPINHDCIVHLLEAYKMKGRGIVKNTVDDRVPVVKDYDFSNTNSDLIAVINGHLHRDMDSTVNGVKYISSCCSLNSSKQYNRNDSTLDTIEEECFDVIEIDTEYRKLRMKRVGAGNDREYDY